MSILNDSALIEGSKILIVDDSIDNIEFLTYILEQAGFVVSVAMSGQQALESVEIIQPDLILLDVVMPEMDGFEVCKKLKLNPAVNNIPIIFITAEDSPSEMIKGFKLGAVDYVVRPVQRDEVIIRIRTHLLMQNLVKRLQYQKEKAEQATQLKDKFVSLVAHDLRGPFNALLGYLQLLKDDDEDPLSDGQKATISQLITSGQRQLSMINEILDIGRLQSGKITLKCRFWDTACLINAAVDKVQLLAQQKQITLSHQVDKHIRFYGDDTLMIQVLMNLMTNALKFSYPESNIDIRVECDDWFKIRVIDYGTGITKEALPALFKLEEKTSTKGTKGEQGTGFGLPYSQEIVMAHKGQILVESEVGQGSCFTVQLPMVTPLVLVVDDDEISQQVVGHYLDSLGAQTLYANNGEQALEKISQHTFHLVITDIHMPNLDGLQLLERIKHNKQTQDIPVILMTGADDEVSRHQGFELGGDDYVIKPIAADDFLPRVRHFIA